MSLGTAERSGSLIETHKGYQPRVVFFYGVLALLFAILVAGLAYRQLARTEIYSEREKIQNQRRILVPGPRGNIYDRSGHLLVGNRPRFAVTLNLDELRREFRRQYLQIRKNYREMGDVGLPTISQMEQISRYTVVQRYLEEINRRLGRQDRLDGPSLERHFRQRLLLPYILVDDLEAEEYARLIEQLPVRSPLQVYTSSTRFYPYGSAAAHTLGTVKIDDPIGAAEDFPGAELPTFKMKGTLGRDGLEARFDADLQGETGGSIYRVDPVGYRVEPPLERRLPIQGKNLISSLDIDLQFAAERVMSEMEMAGAAVALDVRTGEVLVLASKPDYDLNETSPRISTATFQQIESQGGWYHRAVQGTYAPGSTFKVLVATAGLRSGAITTDSEVNCQGSFLVGNIRFLCNDGHAHGRIGLVEAISRSCNAFFYKYGLDTGSLAIGNEAQRFGLDQPTGIELPHETRRMIVPTPAWFQRVRGRQPYSGDTANLSIGQGDLDLTPLQMACFTASFARRQTLTQPTLLHLPDRPPQQQPPIGLSAEAYAAIVQGMEACTVTGTAARALRLAHIPAGVRVAGKTGTAQKHTERGIINFAWFICFAPVERPEIAIAVMMEGDTPGEETGGSRYAVPVAGEILKVYFEKQASLPNRAD